MNTKPTRPEPPEKTPGRGGMSGGMGGMRGGMGGMRGGMKGGTGLKKKLRDAKKAGDKKRVMRLRMRIKMSTERGSMRNNRGGAMRRMSRKNVPGAPPTRIRRPKGYKRRTSKLMKRPSRPMRRPSRPKSMRRVSIPMRKVSRPMKRVSRPMRRRRAMRGRR